MIFNKRPGVTAGRHPGLLLAGLRYATEIAPAVRAAAAAAARG